MALTPLGEDTYPDPLIAHGRNGAGLWRVLLLGLFLVGVAVGVALFGEYISPDLIMTFVGVLAVVGIFCLFGLAAGLFRFANGEERRTISNAVVDSLPFGAVVADRDGKISYVNAHYGAFSGAMTNGVPVGVPRLFAGQSDASEAIYRLSRAVAADINVMDFVEAAKLRGEGKGWIIFREILPNALSPLVSELGLRFIYAVLFLSALSFLGLGVQPPNADWGGMVRENRDGIVFGIGAALIPAAAIAALAISVNLVADWVLNRTSSLKGGRGG